MKCLFVLLLLGNQSFKNGFAFLLFFFSFNKPALPVLLYFFFGLATLGIFGRVDL